MIKKLKQIIKILKQIKELNKKTLTFYIKDKNDINYQTYKYFNKRHPKFLLIRNKSIGACLLEKPSTIDDYTTGKLKQILRTNSNKAQKLGYYFDCFDIKNKKIQDEILKINNSGGLIRQGRDMNPSYLDINKVIEAAKDKKLCGIFNKDGILKAYLYLIEAGDFVIVSRILGDADANNDGIMYLMVLSLIKEWINNKQFFKFDPNYLFYDTWFGAKDGLKEFKKRLGFIPYRVKYKIQKGEK